MSWHFVTSCSRMPNRSEPYFGLSISRVDPLPHQLEAVYEHLLKLPRVRFLLADDAGAGKTIMAGLLIRELKLRGLIERVLVVCPANLTFQWQRELDEKFDEKFLVFKGSDIRDQFGVNQWLEQKLDNEVAGAEGRLAQAEARHARCWHGGNAGAKSWAASVPSRCRASSGWRARSSCRIRSAKPWM